MSRKTSNPPGQKSIRTGGLISPSRQNMSNKETVLDFIDTWRQNPQRLHVELGSLSNETHRLPDNFHFLVSEEGLVDPETGVLVKKVIDRKRFKLIYFSFSLLPVEVKIQLKLEFVNRADRLKDLYLSYRLFL